MMIPISSAALATHMVRYGIRLFESRVKKIESRDFSLFNSKYVKLDLIGPLQQGFKPYQGVLVVFMINQNS